MRSVAIQVFCWLALGLTVLGAVVIASVGAFYNPGSNVPWLFVAMAAPILIATLLVLMQRVRQGPLEHFSMIVAGAVGLILAGFMAYWLVVDSGDWPLYLPPFLLGVGLLALAFEPRRRSS